MTPALESVLVKIDRAKVHIADLNTEIGLLIDSCDKGTRGKGNPKTREYILWLDITPIVPPTISALAGDAIHNLRSALDHLAYQLVKARGTPTRDPTQNTTFPILETPPTPNRFGRFPPPQIAPSVSREVREALAELQPYKRSQPHLHPLAVLHNLDIVDKHRQLLLAVVGVSGFAWMGDVEMSGFNPGPYKAGDEIARFKPGPGDLPPNFQPNVTFQVDINESRIRGVIGTLGGPADYLSKYPLAYIENEVIPRLSSFLS